ncbi:MAG: ABC transporter permease [Terracidiphilus sp.]|jgi:predicted permease
MRSILQDIRYAVRQLRKSPGFTLTVVITLALGIGANTAVFSVMNAVLMKLLPVSRAEGLSYMRMANGQGQPPRVTSSGDSRTAFSLATFEALRQRTDVFEELIAYVPLSLDGSVAVRHGELPDTAEGEEVSGNFFSGLGARLERGRGFTLQDEKNHAPVVVLSYDYWTRSFARDPGVVGQTLYIKSIPVTVVGVAAHGFQGIEPGASTDFWIPLQDRPELNAWGANFIKLYDSHWFCLRVMARLRPGVSAMRAQQALTGAFGKVVKQSVGSVDPKEWKPLLDFVPVRGLAGAEDPEGARAPITILMGMVGLVLLIACTNVAMMVIARNTVRQREFSLRLAIGAGRAAIFRQLLCESILLVSAGAALGWLFALAATQLLATRSGVETGMAPDRSVLIFTLLISALATLFFGLVPLWSAMRAPVAGVLRATSANTTTSRSRIIGGRIVLAGQMAICLVLLMAAMLLLSTLRNYATQNLGMQAEGLLVFGVTPQGQTDGQVFYRTLSDRLRQLPGVESVSMAILRPGTGWSNNSDGYMLDGVEKRGEMVRSNNVGPGFFHTMGVPILAGRDIAESDTHGTQMVALVNETFVKKFLSNTNPLGHVMGRGDYRTYIVGVVRDSKYTAVNEEPMPMAYMAAMQMPLNAMQIEVRVRGDAMSMLPEVRKAVASLYPNVPLEKPMTQHEQFDKSYEPVRILASLCSFFGLLAAFLVATGLYGTYSFRVSRRTTEIGVRMALGASRGQVLAMVLRESLWVLVAGLAAGIPLTLLAVRPLKSMLYQMSPLDPVSFILAIAIMILVSGCAALVPARRAASIEPMQALRAE